MQLPILDRMRSVSSFWRCWNESRQSGFHKIVAAPGKDDGEDCSKDEAFRGRCNSEEERFFWGEPLNILPGIKMSCDSIISSQMVWEYLCWFLAMAIFFQPGISSPSILRLATWTVHLVNGEDTELGETSQQKNVATRSTCCKIIFLKVWLFPDTQFFSLQFNRM